MTSASHLQQAHLLLQHRRYDLAERKLRQVLTTDPDEPLAHALLAISLAERKRHDEAQREAREAVRLAPDNAFSHLVLGQVMLDADKLPEARRAATQAVRLEPDDAAHHALLGATYLAAERWDEALAAADRGLAVDAEHTGCANLRAAALTRLGRKDEAYETIRKTLADDPHNASTHASQGWAMLHANRPGPALEHFREALRLEPELDWAKSGMVEALKARNPVYRGLLAYFLWMGRLGTGARWGVILGLYIIFRVVRTVAESSPELAPYLWPILGLYFAFVLLTWLGPAFFNALLWLHPHGRYALSPPQRLQSGAFVALLVPALGCLAWWLAGGETPALFATIYFGFTLLHVTAMFNFHGTRLFRRLAIAIGIVAAGGAAILANLLIRGGGAAGLFLWWLAPAVAIELYIVFGGSRRPDV